MYGIYVHNTSNIPYADAIAQGYKTIETRNKNTLKQLIEKRVAIIRTTKNKKPCVIGYVTITRAAHCPAAVFPVYWKQHLIPPGSRYDTTDKGKYFYYLEKPEKCTPYFLPKNTINHGRAFCEFDINEVDT